MRSLPGPVAAAYEASPTGLGLYRALTAAGMRCEVVALAPARPKSLIRRLDHSNIYLLNPDAPRIALFYPPDQDSS